MRASTSASSATPDVSMASGLTVTAEIIGPRGMPCVYVPQKVR
jgi:hypothetical protein